MGKLIKESAVKNTYKVLVFDTECRPLSYMGNDYTSGEITAIAAGWADKNKIECKLLGVDSQEDMLDWFLELYDQADVVCGHYIRKHDLPLLNASQLELGKPPISSKLVQDTYADLSKKKYFSASQESLSDLYGLSNPKHHMTQPAWRAANRLTPEGIKETKKRVIDDVKQNKELREILIKNKALRTPRMWTPF
jgi:hypothetical protein